MAVHILRFHSPTLVMSPPCTPTLFYSARLRLFRGKAISVSSFFPIFKLSCYWSPSQWAHCENSHHFMIEIWLTDCPALLRRKSCKPTNSQKVQWSLLYSVDGHLLLPQGCSRTLMGCSTRTSHVCLWWSIESKDVIAEVTDSCRYII